FDIEGPVLAEAHLIDIDRENLSLREAVLENRRDHHLAALTTRPASLRQKKRPRHLHRQRGTALHAAMVQNRRQHSFYQSPIVDPAVLEETAVFNGHN